MTFHYVVSEDMYMAIIRDADGAVVDYTGPWALEEDCHNYFNNMMQWYEDHPDEVAI